MASQAGIRTDAQALRDSRPHALDEDVGARGELQHLLHALRPFQVGDQRAPSPAGDLEARVPRDT